MLKHSYIKHSYIKRAYIGPASTSTKYANRSSDALAEEVFYA